MRVSPSPFTAKSVFDADNEPLGRIVGSELSKETREPTSLLVEPTQELADQVDLEGFWLDVDQVSSIRRSSCQIDISVADLLAAHDAP